MGSTEDLLECTGVRVPLQVRVLLLQVRLLLQGMQAGEDPAGEGRGSVELDCTREGAGDISTEAILPLDRAEGRGAAIPSCASC